ncbi:hypothetical protein [Streptomyces graminofaciens]|uniref:hypothetical protein n=1 Tax=Streptomyces graminofaciens TaxID=68212 RepID=UPI0025736F3B|nr:hypothetical protein [Streptomyces graminofaciens]
MENEIRRRAADWALRAGRPARAAGEDDLAGPDAVLRRATLSYGQFVLVERGSRLGDLPFARP